MSNSYESMKGDAGYLALGAGSYFGLVWILVCWPAFIIGLAISRLVYGVVPEGAGYDMSDERFVAISLSVGVMVVVSIIIFILYLLDKWFFLLILYLLTAWPFFNILRHLCHSGGVGEPPIYPLPLDWCFLF
jgi:hypothetical protein